MFAAPETPLEASLASIWAEVLTMDRVGRDDDLFALGADSNSSVPDRGTGQSPGNSAQRPAAPRASDGRGARGGAGDEG